MKKLITLLLLFTLVGFLSGNQVVITNDYNFIITQNSTYSFTVGTISSNTQLERTNKIEIQNNKVLADPLKYHYVFFWDEADTFIGYYKTNSGITISGAYLGQVNTQSIPLPLNAYSFALVRYNHDYVVVGGRTNKVLFEDNSLITNQTFGAGTTGWLTSAASVIFTVDNGIGSVSLTGGSYQGIRQALTPIPTNHVIYYNVKARSLTLSHNIQVNTANAGINEHTLTTTFQNFSSRNLWLEVYQDFFGIANVTANRTSLIDYAYILNLTTIFGAGNEPTLATMNTYSTGYDIYLQYTHINPLTFANQTLSYETIYFDDGVSTEIEAIGSILIFTIIGFTLMIFGFTSRRRLFNLLSIGAFVVLGFLLIEFVGFIIILFGLIFINVYYTFFGDL
jgi:uncharacterized protein YcfL